MPLLERLQCAFRPAPLPCDGAISDIFSQHLSFTFQVSSQFARLLPLLKNFSVPSDPFPCLVTISDVRVFLSTFTLHVIRPSDTSS